MEVSKLLDAVPQPESVWHNGNLLAVLQDTHYQLLGALVDFVASGNDLSIEQGWLEGFGEQLTDDEIGFLTRIVQIDRRISRLMYVAGNEEPQASQEDSESHPLLNIADRYRV